MSWRLWAAGRRGNEVVCQLRTDVVRARNTAVAIHSGDIEANNHLMSPANGTSKNSSAGSLREELQRLYSLRPSLDTFAEEAIRLIISESGVDAAAIFTYVQRKDQLTPLIVSGLDESGMTAVRANIGRKWDIPLRSIRNRRINVIDAAHENPFVPDSLKAIRPGHLTIASIPFFHANTPVGVAVLFASAPDTFTDHCLRNLSQGLRVCGAAIVELPRTSVSLPAAHVDDSGAPGSEQPNLLRGLSALKSELVRLTAALEESERQRANEVAERVTAQSFLKAAQQRSERAEQELHELREKQKRIPELERDGAELTKRLNIATELAEKAKARVVALDADLEERIRDNEVKAKELAELRAKRAELERDLQRAGDLAQRHEQSATDLNEQLGRLDSIKAEAERLRAVLESTTQARADAEERVAELERALAAAETARKELFQELSESKSVLDSTMKEREGLYVDALKNWEKAEEIEKKRTDLAREREHLRTTNESFQERIRELESERVALEAARKEQVAALEQLVNQVATLEAQRTHLHEELERIRGDSNRSVNDLREQLEKVDRDRTGLSEQIAALKRVEEERDRLIARVEDLEGDVGTTRKANKQLEAKVAELKKDAERLDIEKGALEMRIEVLAEGEQNLSREKNQELAQVRSEAEGLRAQVQEREAVLQRREQEFEDSLGTERRRAEAGLEEARGELARVCEHRERLENELRAIKADETARDELLSTAEQEQMSLGARLAEVTAERERLSADLERVLGELQRSMAEKGAAEGRIAELEEGLRSLREGDLAAMRSELESVTQIRVDLEEALVSAQDRHTLELVDLQDQLGLAHRERDQMSQSLAEREQLLQSAEHDLTKLDLDDVGEDDDLALEIERSGGTDLADAPAASDVPSVNIAVVDEIVLLDVEASINVAVQQLSEIGHRVTRLNPEPESTGAMAQTAFACAAINLAAPAAWSTLRKMRNGSGVPHTPMIAYALSENAQKGFWLGPVDFVTLPIGDTDLRKLISNMAPNLRRVIAMSHDFDVMEQVRAQLTVGRISTAVVLDGRQALDLVPTVKPQAAVLHMSPNCTDVFRAVAGLRAREETRNIPILFLLDHEAQPREEAFVTAGIRMLSGRGTLVPDNLPASLITALNGFQTAGSG